MASFYTVNILEVKIYITAIVEGGMGKSSHLK